MNKTVLIIDDDDMLRETLSRGLRGSGFDVLGANSAAKGAEVLVKITPDAIVLDRMMTGTDGLTFLKGIRARGNQTPVIMLTALSGPDNAIDGLSGGANDYLTKPFKLQELILRLNNITKDNITHTTDLPDGLLLIDGEFFIKDTYATDASPKLLGLSGEEKKLLELLLSPMGNIVPAMPMVAKRLRGKLNVVLSGMDIITIRGKGYKLIQTETPENKGLRS